MWVRGSALRGGWSVRGVRRWARPLAFWQALCKSSQAQSRALVQPAFGHDSTPLFECVSSMQQELGDEKRRWHRWRSEVLRLFPPCALIAHAQGSSGVVENMPFAWRGHTKSLTTRARPSPDLAVWLE